MASSGRLFREGFPLGAGGRNRARIGSPMALPVAPPPKPNDVAVLGWAGLTVRVAWTLLEAGVKIRPDVLREARTHVLYHLDPTVPLAHAEDLATRLTEEFVARARGQAPSDPWVADWEMPLTQRWRRALDQSLDEVSVVVFRKHYGDSRPLSKIEEQLGVDRAAIEAAQSGLREVVRGIGVSDGLPLDGWPPERIDRLLRRIAAHAPGPCPPPLDVAMGSHVDHVRDCARCNRLTRLVRSSVIEVDDLFPPTVGARPTARTRVLAVQLHPEGRRARKLLVESLPGPAGRPAFPVGEDLLLLQVDTRTGRGSEGTEIGEAIAVLRTAAEVASPSREHLRGVVLEGPGAWTERGLVGPLAEKAAREVLHRSWGTIALSTGPGPLDVVELPPPLPEPPSARRMWLLVAAMSLLLGIVLSLALLPQDSPVAEPLQAEFTPGRGGMWAAFDVPEEALVTLVGLRDGVLWTVLSSRKAADKVAYATGDGSYRLFVPGDGVLLLVTDAPLADPTLTLELARAASQPEPLGALAEQLQDQGTVRWQIR